MVEHRQAIGEYITYDSSRNLNRTKENDDDILTYKAPESDKMEPALLDSQRTVTEINPMTTDRRSLPTPGLGQKHRRALLGIDYVRDDHRHTPASGIREYERYSDMRATESWENTRRMSLPSVPAIDTMHAGHDSPILKLQQREVSEYRRFDVPKQIKNDSDELIKELIRNSRATGAIARNTPVNKAPSPYSPQLTAINVPTVTSSVNRPLSANRNLNTSLGSHSPPRAPPDTKSEGLERPFGSVSRFSATRVPPRRSSSEVRRHSQPSSISDPRVSESTQSIYQRIHSKPAPLVRSTSLSRQRASLNSRSSSAERSSGASNSHHPPLDKYSRSSSYDRSLPSKTNLPDRIQPSRNSVSAHKASPDRKVIPARKMSIPDTVVQPLNQKLSTKNTPIKRPPASSHGYMTRPSFRDRKDSQATSAATTAESVPVLSLRLGDKLRAVPSTPIQDGEETFKTCRDSTTDASFGGSGFLARGNQSSEFDVSAEAGSVEACYKEDFFIGLNTRVKLLCEDACYIKSLNPGRIDVFDAMKAMTVSRDWEKMNHSVETLQGSLQQLESFGPNFDKTMKIKHSTSNNVLNVLTQSILSGRSQPARRACITSAQIFINLLKDGTLEMTPTAGTDLIIALAKRSVRGINPDFVASSATLALLSWAINAQRGSSIWLINNVLGQYQGSEKMQMMLYLIILILLRNSKHVSRVWPRSKNLVLACVNASRSPNKNLRNLGLMGCDLLGRILQNATRENRRNIAEMRQIMGPSVHVKKGAFSYDEANSVFLQLTRSER